MKTIKKYFIVAFLFVVFLITGCQTGGGENPPTPPVETDLITVTAKQTNITIKDKDVAGFDFKGLFDIRLNGKTVEVIDEYINKDTVLEEPGTYIVTCTYREEKASVDVTVLETVYTLDLSKNEVTIHQSQVEVYDFLTLFHATIDGKEIDITSDMVESNIESKPGSYTITVTNGNMKKTLTIHVTELNKIEIVAAYGTFEITLSELADFDYTSLFLLYVDNKAVKVSKEMIDTSSLNNATVGNTYPITLTYTIDKVSESKSIQIKVVEDEKIIVNVKNIVTYPNSESIDLTTLFEIKKGENNIPVTIDMITGSIDYSKVGINEIVLSYENEIYIATVEVKRGVIIDYAYSDTILIVKGTKKETYDFVGDFRIIINGIEFTNLSMSYLDISNVNFDAEGIYEAIIKIPYNDNKIGLSGVTFTYFEKKITYKVINNNYVINVLEENVVLPVGTTNYNVFHNLSVVINNRNQQLTTVPGYVDLITCYANVVSEPIDFTSVKKQEVQIDVYVNGVDSEPVRVTYTVMIDSDIHITSLDKIIFTNDTLYTTELFTIMNGTTPVEVTTEMISGIINTFQPGVYEVELNYNDIISVAKVYVLDSALKGTYHTGLTTIPEIEEEDDSDWGEYGSSGYSTRASTVNVLGDLIIENANTFIVNGKEAKVLRGIDENTVIIQLGSYEYTVYFENGVAVLDPDNSIKLGFTEVKRPFVYFSEDKWNIVDQVTINYGSNHVLQGTIINYSFDIFKISSVDNNATIWYGLFIHLIEKTSADTIYDVKWGEVNFAENFEKEEGNVSSFVFHNHTYHFTMQTTAIGKINGTQTEERYRNITFTGIIDGKPAELRFDSNGGLGIYVDQTLIEQINTYTIQSMKNGGVNVKENTIFVYDFEESVYSYKFTVDPTNLTFALHERDEYFGVYQGNDMLIFLDGYGTGIVNFNTKSYYEYQIVYSHKENIFVAEFVNTKSTFEYGEYIEFHMTDLLNVITIKDCQKKEYNEKVLENTYITDGAIINIDTYRIGQNSDTIAKNALYSAIHITTKDGILSNEEKAKMIDTSAIRFNTPGFYQFTIKVNVKGAEVISYYAVEIIESIYPNHPVVATYGNGVILNTNSLSIDEYGRIILISNGVTYNGMVTIADDYSFIAKAKNDKKMQITITGTYIAEGLIEVKCSGVISFVDYFTTGTVKVSGTGQFVLRRFVLKNENIFILSSSMTSTGEVVMVESMNAIDPSSTGAILKILTTNGESYCKINSWDNGKNGLVLSDKYRGTYTNESGVDIVIDGFGNARIGETNGTYMMNSDVATITTLSTTKVYRLNIADYTYESIDVTLDNSLLSGKTYVAEYNYLCGSYMYVATTTFIFADNGKVIIQSVSPSHDDGEDACMNDQYEPSFASKKGVEGTYLVNGNKVKINVNGHEFTFLIDNVLTTNSMTCLETTISSNEHGYFKEGTMFNKQ